MAFFHLTDGIAAYSVRHGCLQGAKYCRAFVGLRT